MANLTAGNKDYSMLKPLYILLMFVSSCSSSKLSTNMETTLEIDFQDFFKNDKVSLEFNGCSILVDAILNSDESTGLTSVRLKVYKKGDKNYQIIYSGLSTNCVAKDDKIEIIVVLNGKPNKFLIDVNAGKFIGFSKKNQTELFLNQSKNPFEYN